jgi:hypothetical protein
MNRSRTLQPAIWITAIALMLCACSSDTSPKPTGYPRFDLEEPDYTCFNSYAQFVFEVAADTEIEPIVDTLAGEWFSIRYPRFNAQLYCGYTPTDTAGIAQMKEEALRLLSHQIQRADAFNEEEYENPQRAVYALVYSLKGNAASPVQFYITDREKAFFKGALYFDTAVNRDSIAPVLDYLSRDVQVLIETFRWKK